MYLRVFIVILILSSCWDAAGRPAISPRPDTIPPPPPGGPGMLSGPSTACTGQTSVYTVEVPVDCSCQWAVNTTIQPDTSASITITWTQPGTYIVTVTFICPGGQTSDPQAVVTVVGPPPPVVDLGNDTTLQTGQTLLLDAGNPGSGYLWSTGATTQTVLVSQTGTYAVEVFNACGSDEDTIVVTILVGLPEPDPVGILLYRSEANRLIITEYPDDFNHLEIFEISGKKMYSGDIRKETPLPSPGIYILKLSSEAGILTRKIILPR